MPENPISAPSFLTRTPFAPALTLRRRKAPSPLEVSEVSASARESIQSIVDSAKTTAGGPEILGSGHVSELESKLRQLEGMMAGRERVIAEQELRLAEKERDLAEGEALLKARERMLKAANLSERSTKPVTSQEEQVALVQLKAELEKQEAAFVESKQELREREVFLEESENTLFEKVQSQQEKETELEQLAEELEAREQRLNQREAELNSAAAAALPAKTDAPDV